MNGSRIPPGFIRLLGATVAMFLSVFLAIAVAPVAAEQAGRRADAGLITAVFSGFTVLAQLWMPRILRASSTAAIFVWSFALLSLPNVAFIFMAQDLSSLLVASAVRGVGFGIAVVVAVLLVTDAGPTESRGRMLGYFGLVVTIPAVIGPSLGLHLNQSLGLAAPFVLSAAAAAVGGVLALPTRGASIHAQSERGMHVVLKDPQVLLPLLVNGLASAAFGGVLSFVPIALTDRGWRSAAAFFLVAGLARGLARWQASMVSDHWTPTTVLVSGPVIAAGGAVMLAGGRSTVLILMAALLMGAGLGVIQNVSYLALLRAVTRSAHGQISTLWNMSTDGGTMVGAAALALVETRASLETAFWTMPFIIMGGLLLAIAGAVHAFKHNKTEGRSLSS